MYNAVIKTCQCQWFEQNTIIGVKVILNIKSLRKPSHKSISSKIESGQRECVNRTNYGMVFVCEKLHQNDIQSKLEKEFPKLFFFSLLNTLKRFVLMNRRNINSNFGCKIPFIFVNANAWVPWQLHTPLVIDGLINTWFYANKWVET